MPLVLQAQLPYARYFYTLLIRFHSLALPKGGFIAQLVEHRTGIVEVTGSNPVEALIFFQASYFQLLKLEITAMIILHFHLQLQFKI